MSLVGLLIVLSTVHTAVYTTTKRVVVEQMCASSQSTAVAISAYITEGIDEYKEFLTTRDVESDYYTRMQTYFSAVKSASNIRFIYTERPIDEETVEFILDAEPIDSEAYSPPGSTTFMDTASRTVYDTGLPALLELTVSSYGTLLGGCAPIFDTNGELLGLVGVNMDALDMVNSMNSVQFTLFTIYAVLITLSLFLLYRYSEVILEPMLKDKLTGAYSKRYMDKLLQTELRSSMKSGAELAVMMCDLDHFKKVNDTYGHPFGDVVLASVAKTIMGCLRKTDYFFRYGGEEFVVLLTRADVVTVSRIAERIRSSVEKTPIFNKDINEYITITISIGISHLTVSKELIEAADKALYNAKKTRNSISVFRGDDEQGEEEP